ncbi:hypothetical protein [Paraburkholderia megapolitana]|uniref:hypothetical protein n=1 Tax=Paraburkholderia megapolitana TaxID=420953 RepID=UPI0038BCF58D
MHDVQALIAADSLLAGLPARFASAVVCPLVQGLVLVPVTDALARELPDAGPEIAASSSLSSWEVDIAQGVATFASQLSAAGLIAYISTEFFGGRGGQDALVWANGRIVLALRSNEDNALPWPNTPVSQALRFMGIKADAGKDEFDTVGLGRHRSTRSWAAAYASS